MTAGEALIRLLEQHGVEVVFGIPGVHTIELYRGLADSAIRHITPRHEQGAAFMADGYARVSGKPGVALLITGPGLTNAITAMAQARADSVPMLVISGVNAVPTLGKGLGFLHELPDQRGLLEKVALFSHRLTDAAELPGVLARAFSLFAGGRGGPVHIEIPLDVMAREARDIAFAPPVAAIPGLKPSDLARAAEMARSARRPVMLAGGGAKRAGSQLRAVAERLGAPVVMSTNARGLLHAHPLGVPASPSFKAVRAMLAEADLAIAVGTEFGPTDYDMYADGGFVAPRPLIRIDIDAEQLERHPADLPMRADAGEALAALSEALAGHEVLHREGEARAARARDLAREELAALAPHFPAQLEAVEAIRDALPGAVVVGDSTQPVYAANLFYDHDRPGGWFNAATGYGALGYGAPAAIGAAIADPGAAVVCLTGDGGLQFSLAEIGSAKDAGAAVIVVVWNNSGYREIEAAMRDARVEPVGVTPSAPDFCVVAQAYGVPAERIEGIARLRDALRRARASGGPYVVELVVPPGG